MLDVLRLTNYTVVDSVELLCGPGLNVLTGETGAGKSIIVDALNLLLGGRGSPTVVRPGTAQAELEGIFDLADSPKARNVLAALDLPVDDQLVLRRVLSAAGKSRAYANGHLVPLTSLTALRDVLCDFHGQHDHQSLVRSALQLELLDAVAGLESPRRTMATVAAELGDAGRHLQALQERQRSKAQRQELLREDLERLQAIPLEPGVDDTWREDRDRLANVEELQRLVAEATTWIGDAEDETPTAGDLLGRAGRSIRAAAGFDASLAPHADALAGAREIVDDVVRALQRYRDGLEDDPAALEQLHSQLHALDRLKRRHAVTTVEELIVLRDACGAELAQLDAVEHDLSKAQAARAAAEQAAATAAATLSRARAKAAKALAKRLTQEIRRLGMPDGTLEIQVTRTTVPDGAVEVEGARYDVRPTGIDRVTMLFSANRGMPARPLRDVASGGELSRVMLALKAAQAGTIPLLVFDEIDAGIGGNVGNAVADKLVALGAARQVFCVTHLPQIAARAGTHWRVDKQVRGKSTTATVTAVQGDARARELARMFGDDTAPETALEHAHALLSSTR